ncbi:hypothetical protein EZV62_018335 [Acer yangbiense]|uniref:Uncharacterized protein n=1 Tax=Acer yangbiense TaxID=1000413 RepID=A0A5C7HL19_9ROSI|nr:hypothetical protein EZV62_018335 [Acer yangbiense]
MAVADLELQGTIDVPELSGLGLKVEVDQQTQRAKCELAKPTYITLETVLNLVVVSDHGSWPVSTPDAQQLSKCPRKVSLMTTRNTVTCWASASIVYAGTIHPKRRSISATSNLSWRLLSLRENATR